jgi:hypothetical protein
VPLNNFYQWWRYQPGADWRHPTGPGSTIDGRGDYPVVQVCYEDAQAYAQWAGKRLPTEAEWGIRRARRLSGKLYAWGDSLRPNGKWMANTWQGRFPVRDEGSDGFVGVAPVAKFPPNGYGLYDVAGNVWEWTTDWYRADAYAAAGDSVLHRPQGPSTYNDPAEPSEPKRVQRGGSFLCSDEYCSRYMVGTRGKGEVRTASNHLGFRCVEGLTMEAQTHREAPLFCSRAGGPVDRLQSRLRLRHDERPRVLPARCRGRAHHVAPLLAIALMTCPTSTSRSLRTLRRTFAFCSSCRFSFGRKAHRRTLARRRQQFLDSGLVGDDSGGIRARDAKCGCEPHRLMAR